jgi:serine/threonine protein kinase/Tol biopolymer transport system component
MSLVGRTVGRYRITEKLGEGGMGVVYRAQDATLGRDVAIKLLHAEAGQHPERVRRFSQEARAASALNHPNIITVHDAGEFESGPFIVMELVEGDSLRAHLRRGALPLAKILDIGIQAATALARAHEAGITHRDLKPENILLRSDGYVKVLDFGLAKLREREPFEGASTVTIDAALTSEGTIVGTAAYMSPEQSTGGQVDGRSDIFSLALALYECWQGHHPFLRKNSLDTRYAIAHDRLPDLTYPAGTPEWGLARTLQKALEKEPEDRYQTIKDLGIDLRRLKQDSESGKLASTGAPASSRPARKPLVYALAALVILALLGSGAWRFFHAQQPRAPTRLEYTQLTNFADSATSPALSPDGRMLAFVRGENTVGGPGQIYIKLLPDGEPTQLTRHGPDVTISRPRFSLDGARIAYGIMENWTLDTWVVPVLGGQPRLFLPNSMGLTWVEAEAGQSRVMYSELTGKGPQMGIFTSTESRAQRRTIYLPRAEEAGMAHFSYLSPDRKWILLAEMDAGSWLPCRLTPFDGSSPGRPVGPAPAQCTEAAWSPDGKWMYFTANAGTGYHIWRQSFPDGQPEQVTAGATQEEGIAFAPDGRSFVTTIGQSQSTLWFHDSRGDRQITSEGFAVFPSLSADGKKLYYLLRAGGAGSWISGELWVADLESGQRQRLLPDVLMQHYTVSRDGRRVVFVEADAARRSPVWIAAIDRGSAPRQLASGGIMAFFGADGDVLFQGYHQERTNIFLYGVKGDGSEPPQVLPAPLYQGRQLDFTAGPASISSNGKWVVVQGGIVKLWGAVVVYPVNGGTPTVVCAACATPPDFERGWQDLYVDWTPDEKFLYLNFRGSVYAIPLRPGQALPPIPASGFRTRQEVAALPGARLIREPHAVTGPNPSIYAYPRFATQRNIYRIPAP